MWENTAVTTYVTLVRLSFPMYIDHVSPPHSRFNTPAIIMNGQFMQRFGLGRINENTGAQFSCAEAARRRKWVLSCASTHDISL